MSTAVERKLKTAGKSDRQAGMAIIAAHSNCPSGESSAPTVVQRRETL
jgi:pyruvate/2-oxoacid:ferredoxin oxidoreductase beta subunit